MKRGGGNSQVRSTFLVHDVVKSVSVYDVVKSMCVYDVVSRGDVQMDRSS